MTRKITIAYALAAVPLALAPQTRTQASTPSWQTVATLSDAQMQRLQDVADYIAQHANLPRPTADFARNVRAELPLHGSELTPMQIDGMVNVDRDAPSLAPFLNGGKPELVGRLFASINRNVNARAKGSVADEQWMLATIGGELSASSYVRLNNVTAWRQQAQPQTAPGAFGTKFNDERLQAQAPATPKPTWHDIATMSDAQMKKLQEMAQFLAENSGLPAPTPDFARNVRSELPLHGKDLTPAQVDGMVNIDTYAPSVKPFLTGLGTTRSAIAKLFDTVKRDVGVNGTTGVADEQWRLAAVSGDFSRAAYANFGNVNAMRKVTQSPYAPGSFMSNFVDDQMHRSMRMGMTSCGHAGGNATFC